MSVSNKPITWWVLNKSSHVIDALHQATYSAHLQYNRSHLPVHIIIITHVHHNMFLNKMCYTSSFMLLNLKWMGTHAFYVCQTIILGRWSVRMSHKCYRTFYCVKRILRNQIMVERRTGMWFCQFGQVTWDFWNDSLLV